ncbi:MAG: glycogen/starch/alpha-glucan phosphorylase [Xanthobacteraceae bacterium]|nr:glycogen/starch/alpha-glucan phosphorylase [Xanthobacteraceae bacterium]
MPKTKVSRTTWDVPEIKSSILNKLMHALGVPVARATAHDWYMATALALRDRIADHWLATEGDGSTHGHKRVCYLSLEFLIGRLLTDSLSNLCLLAPFQSALDELGLNFQELRACEPDPGLGNGGLGRLAACFMESLSTLRIPAIGYGIRYDYGLFRQIIADGWQKELPDDWLASGNPWEFPRLETNYTIGFGGTAEDGGHGSAIWHPAETVRAVAYDTPVVGWRGRHVNALRLWSAAAPEPFDIDAFNAGDQVGAVASQARAQAISRLLYPSDDTAAGRELRLRQEYFFVSASLQDIVSRTLRTPDGLRGLPDVVAVQLNDTHPSLAVAELMRLLVDGNGLPWDEAWRLTTQTLSYTNHTLLPEALETWPAALLGAILPRHLQIIERINRHHLADAAARLPDSPELESGLSLIEERGERRIRMGHLAFVGSHRVNGVSAMHTELMKQTVFRDLHRLYPDRIINKTNGITFRRWLTQANPPLTVLLREACGDAVLDDPRHLETLERHADDAAFHSRFLAARIANKRALTATIAARLGLAIAPDALFDVQIKRIHEYKRQLLNALETIALYQSIRDEPGRAWTPRVKLFAGKAAASYRLAKLIIKLINDVAAVVNRDDTIRGLLKVAFLPDYNVTLAEQMIPAADLSEQISTAGMEASGTGNMKLALNGALTIGTLDGANIEILDHVGAGNIFIFGLTAAEVDARRAAGLDANDVIKSSRLLRRAIEALERGEFSPDDPARFRPLTGMLRSQDRFMVARDFEAYWATQRSIDRAFRDGPEWTRRSILNVARMGCFSSDRTIADYASDIWHVPVVQG